MRLEGVSAEASAIKMYGKKYAQHTEKNNIECTSGVFLRRHLLSKCTEEGMLNIRKKQYRTNRGDVREGVP